MYSTNELGNPQISVIIRSFNRLESLKELLNVLARQNSANFEIIVIDQTSCSFESWKNWVNGLSDRLLYTIKPISSDLFVEISNKNLGEIVNRLNLIIYSYGNPIGGPKARNEGVRFANSNLCLFIDDDDLPIGEDWVGSHLNRHLNDNKLIGLSGRQVSKLNERCPFVKFARPFIRRKVLSYNFLKIPYTFARFDECVPKVEWLHGTNTSIKKSYIEKVNGWDEYVQNQDEHSFAFKLALIKKKDEYFTFDSTILIQRRTDIPGGMGKRTFSIRREIKNQWQFISKVIRKYYPLRFYSLIPFYLLIILNRLIQKTISVLPKPKLLK